MAVLKMCKVNICAMKKNRKKILELLQQEGCLEIEEMIEQDEVFGKINTTTQISVYERNAVLSEQALEIMQMYSPEKKSLFASLEGEKIIDEEENEKTAELQQKVMSLVNDILRQKKLIEEKEAAIIRCKDEIKALEPWHDMDLPMNFAGTKHTGFMAGSISGTYTQEALISRLEQIENLPENVYMQVVRADKYQTYVTCVFIKKQQEQVEKALRELGFGKPAVMAHHVPTQSIKNRKDQIAEYDLEIENIKAEIIKESESRFEVKKAADYYRVRTDKYRVLGDLLQSKHTFFITGYIAEKDLKFLREKLEQRFTVSIDVEAMDAKYDVPVSLKNDAFTEPVEGVVTAFGYPNKKEIDPTPFTAIFYYFLFGLMFSDAAYGFIMFLACFILIKKIPNMKESMAKSLKMFMYCGISTLIWGVLFGGYFGDAVTVIGRTFFDVEIAIPPLWFDPIKNSMTMLIYCLVIGIIHLFTGLTLKGYLLLKDKEVKAFAYDVIFWYVFLIGLLLLLISTEVLTSLVGRKISFPAWLRFLSKIMTIGGMLGILLMSGRRAKNPVKRLLLGVYSLYDTTSWLSDLLSYSRLLALGLATSVIAQVINQMASMGGKSVFGVMLFIAVFLFGHAFNMSINFLGAYVHTNRLVFVEFFGKFYEGGGREFKPFKADTKYVKVKEN